MKIKSIAICMMLALLAIGTVAQATTQLYDNGPFITNTGQGSGGADVSALVSPLTSYGFNDKLDSSYSVADDFVVSTGETWSIGTIRFYGYQSASSTTSTFTGLYAQIWNGRPGDSGSSVIWGNLTSNILAASSWSGVYRTPSSDLTNTYRPIMNLDGTVNTSLASGTYWLQWTTTGTLSSGPWTPPITIAGQLSTGNSRQYALTAWQDVVTGTSSYAQGLPFTIYSSSSPAAVPEASTLIGFGSSLAMAAPGLIGWLRRRKA